MRGGQSHAAGSALLSVLLRPRSGNTDVPVADVEPCGLRGSEPSKEDLHGAYQLHRMNKFPLGPDRSLTSEIPPFAWEDFGIGQRSGSPAPTARSRKPPAAARNPEHLKPAPVACLSKFLRRAQFSS
jgi:hypothetical protein